ncbi:DNA methyltransferase [Enterobacter cloacae]|uniref:DNA methyltransferase n=1 Tax=Enterobacter cloacae TaxID=550 RepID=UPI0028F939E7|nr:DNA methyltransferase [Enterobacter cloacae]MDT9877526.1 DNA methyltransferase [Enterobacter cloacae]
MKQNGLFSSDNMLQSKIVDPVTCLGKKFTNDQERREYFLALLAKILKDPQFRKTEGFPIGSDESILNLSDPPYYTACPNPWIGDFIAEWEAQKTAREEEYHREPFAADVSEGKNDPIYNAHSYHTKVPYKAIMRYIIHYTQPGDIIFDGFCGTGMTAVAAQMCGDKDAITALGYQVTEDGTILEKQNEMDEWVPISKMGNRNTIMNDLAPAATFIAHNYNTPIDLADFNHVAISIINKLKNKFGYLYETNHEGGVYGKINYTVWSDIFLCPECQSEINFFEQTVDIDKNEVKDEFNCLTCASLLSKKKLQQKYETTFDSEIGKPISIAKQVPVLINYSVGTKRFEKKPDEEDLDKIKSCEKLLQNALHPSIALPEGYNLKQPKKSHSFTHTHHFYTRRTLVCLNEYQSKCSGKYLQQLTFLMGSVLPKLTKLNRYMRQHGSRALVGPMANALYVPPISVENNVIDQLEFQLKKITKAFFSSEQCSIISTSSSTRTTIPDASVDYIFIDPPFGGNIMYSDMSFLRESWLRLRTNIEKEAIENNVQGKELHDYKELMRLCFSEAFRILRPGRWMTVEFSNTKAAVWNVLQTSLQESGFVVASVAGLDKTRGGFHAMIGPTAVKQDLVISAYKPNGEFEERFGEKVNTEEGVWDFVSTHLKYLPVIKFQDSSLQFIPERDPRILFDQMVAYFVRKGYPVPLSSPEFQKGLLHHFVERDGMIFLPEQVIEYDKKKLLSGDIMQSSLFVKDEVTAIDWLRQLLRNKPQSFSDINPQFMQQLAGWSKNELTLDLRELLEQNFICYDGRGDVPTQIHAYLSTNWKELRNLHSLDPALVQKAKDRWYIPDSNKIEDLEKLRERHLIKEFEEYKSANKKLKIFRIEAIRVGFKKLWEQQEFATLIAIADKLPNNVLEEDPVLLMYYDQAVTLGQVDTDDEW